jgi:hypothetical protein
MGRSRGRPADVPRLPPTLPAAIERRDGAEFWLDKSSRFGPPTLVRLAGLRRIEPLEAGRGLGGLASAGGVFSPDPVSAG